MLANTLNDQQRRFCEEYLIDLCAKDAAVRAGYSHTYAAEIMTIPAVREYISYLKSERSERVKVSADYVLELITETAERARGLIEVRQGLEEGELQVIHHERDPKSVLKAAELLGKHLKMFTEMTETRHTFTQMGNVTVGSAQTGEVKELSFDVGGDPNAIKPD